MKAWLRFDDQERVDGFFGVSRKKLKPWNDRFESQNFILMSPRTFVRAEKKVRFFYQTYRGKRRFWLKPICDAMATDGIGYVFYRKNYIGSYRLRIR